MNFKVYCRKQNNQREMNEEENVTMDLTSHLAAGYLLEAWNKKVSNLLTWRSGGEKELRHSEC